MSSKEEGQKTQRSVFVGNIPYEASEEQLKEIFEQVGPVISFRIVYDRETGKPKGYGFCEYQDLETAQSAMRNLNDYDFHGRNLRVGHAAGETSNAEKAVSQAVTGPPEEPMYGDAVAPDKAPEAISKAVASLPPEQMYELMKQMKLCIQNNPNEARNMLLQNPQLAYALLQAQIVMKIVDPQVALAMLHRQSEQIPPLMPTADEAPKSEAEKNPAPAPQVPVQQPPVKAQDVDHRQQPPLQQVFNNVAAAGGMNINTPGAPVRVPNPVSSMASVQQPGPPPMSMGGPQGPVSSMMGGPMGNPPQAHMSMAGGNMPGPRGGLLGDRPVGPPGGFDNRNMPGPGPRGPPQQGFMDRGGPGGAGMGGAGLGPGPQNTGAGGPPGGFGGPLQGGPPGPGAPVGNRSDPRDPRNVRMGPGGPTQGGMPGPRPGVPGLPAGMMGGPRPGGPGPGGPGAPAGQGITSQDQEKAQLIMQVLQLSDEQIAMLPPDQRQSILILKEQIARSTNP